MSAARSKLRFLPALVLVLLAVLPAYVGSLWSGVANLAIAEEKAAPAEPAAHAEETPPPAEGEKHDSAAPAAEGTTDAAAEAPADAHGADAHGADAHGAEGGHGDAKQAAEDFDPLSLTKEEVDVLRQLAKRRDELAKREQEIADREALLKATEQRLAERVKEMEALKAEYQNARTERENAAEANLRRLVTVYEAMKPDEAARIFETMEGSVLLDVVSRMGERRLAPILAQMTPAKAQALTVAMAHRKTAQTAAKPEG